MDNQNSFFVFPLKKAYNGWEKLEKKFKMWASHYGTDSSAHALDQGSQASAHAQQLLVPLAHLTGH